MKTAAWVDGMRGVDVLKLGQEIGLTASAKPAPGWLSPCPACNAPTRHTKSHDRRGAVGVARGRKGWRCFQCDASGDGLRLVELVIGGAPLRNLDAHRKAEVRTWCKGFLGIGHGAASAPQAAPPAPEEALPDYPPAEELAALWGACVPVVEHAPTVAYLRGRGLDPVRIADEDLARALPDGVALPRWAVFGRRYWPGRGYRLIVPTFDAPGVMRSVIARRVVDADTPKSIPPKGHARSGLVMANALAVQVLELGAKPEWWTGPPLEFVVTEGEIDFLAAATAASDADEHAPAVLGIVSGSLTKRLVARVPSGSVIGVRTDPDDEGAKYAAKILNLCAERQRKGELRFKLERYFNVTWSRKGKAIVRLQEVRHGA